MSDTPETTAPAQAPATDAVESEGQERGGTLAQGIRAWEAAVKAAEARDAALKESEAADSDDLVDADASGDDTADSAEAKQDEPADDKVETKTETKASRIAELARQAREKRLARERESQEKSQAESVKAEVERARAELEAERKRFREEIDSFRKDPAEYYAKRGENPAEVLDRMIKLGMDRNGVQVEDKLSHVESQLKAALERLEKYESSTKEQQEQAQQAQVHERQLQAKQAFVKHVAKNDSKYSILAGEDPATVAEWAVHVAVQAQEAGQKVDFDDIAGMLEETLRADLERRYARIRSETPEHGESRKPQRRARGETLTNAQAAQRSVEESRPLTEHERIRLATKAFEETIRTSDA